MASNSTIPWSKPWINENDIEVVSDAVTSSWISGGSYVDMFENELSNHFDSKPFVTCSNGTAALHLALLSLELSQGDEVILSGYGFMAAANVAILMGLQVRFADILIQDFSIDIESISKLINKKTKAIVMIHTYGFVGNANEILSLCRKHNLFLIEDCAEALFSGDDELRAGEYGDISTYSFHATKTITTGEGGAISTRNIKLLNRIVLLRSHGMNRQIPYLHEIAGLNYRLTNLQAALGVSQIARSKLIKARTLEIHERYERNFAEINENYIRKLEYKKFFMPWSYPVVLMEGFSNPTIIREYLYSKKIETRPGFICPNHLSYLQVENQIEISNQVSKSLINLPLYVTLTNEEVDYISDMFITSIKMINHE